MPLGFPPPILFGRSLSLTFCHRSSSLLLLTFHAALSCLCNSIFFPASSRTSLVGCLCSLPPFISSLLGCCLEDTQREPSSLLIHLRFSCSLQYLRQELQYTSGNGTLRGWSFALPCLHHRRGRASIITKSYTTDKCCGLLDCIGQASVQLHPPIFRRSALRHNQPICIHLTSDTNSITRVVCSELFHCLSK